MDYCTKPSSQKNSNLFCQNFKYNYKITNKDESIYWICRNVGCKASVTIKEGEIIKNCGQRINDFVDLQAEHIATCKPLNEKDMVIDESLTF